MPRLTTSLALVALAALASPVAAADVHRWIDGGTVVYSDQLPPAGVTVTPLPGRPEAPAIAAPPIAAPETAPAEAATPPPEALPPARTGPATVDEILETSGLRPQLPGLARALGAEYLPRPGQLGERDTALVVRIVARQFAPERLYTAIRDDVRRRLDARQLDAMAVWFRSSLGRKITALEIAASRPEAAPRLAALAAGLRAAPPAPVRLLLVQQLDWVSGTTQDTTDLALAVAGSVIRAAAAAAPAERRARAGVVERRVAEMRGAMAAALGDNVRAQMLYVYASLDDAELKQYVNFLASPPGRAYGRATHNALLTVVRDTADRTAAEILRAVPLPRWTAAPKAPDPPR